MTSQHSLPRRTRRAFLVLLAVPLLLAPLAAADKDAGKAAGKAKGEGKSVEELAREGYWGKENQWAEHKDMLGKPAPKLGLSNWMNGEVKAKDMKDKIVVVDYWATWCGPCLAAIPHNNEMSKKYADKGVVIIGACGGGGEEKMGDVAKQHKVEYPVAKVAAASTKAWKVKWWPTYIVIDRKGNVRAFGIKPDYVDKVVDALLEEQPPKAEAAAK
jgi:thiol-disulfide isomerase/thioredoxin